MDKGPLVPWPALVEAIAGADLAHAALEHVAHAQLAADLLDVDSAALVGEARIAGDDDQPTDPRQPGDDGCGGSSCGRRNQA